MQLLAEKNNLYLQTVFNDGINSVWQEVEPLFSRIYGSNQQRYNTSDILKSITEEKEQLWVVRNVTNNKVIMATTTEIILYPKGDKVCFVNDCAGDNMFDWLWVLNLIENWALSIGCSAVQIEGRLGWQRVLKDYKKEKVILSKKLK